MARLPYVNRDMLTGTAVDTYDRIAETRGSIEPDTPMPNSFRVLLNNPEAAAAVGQLGEYLRLNSSLDPVVREIAILSVAQQTGSGYEWAHHEPVARAVGVRPVVIEGIHSGRAPMGLPAKEGVFAQAAKELVDGGNLTEHTFQAIEHLLGPSGVVDFIVLVGYYAMLATALRALGVDVEEELGSD
ncbi:MAG: carboxymuconolactone decarboxylase family protein [Dehalococcoidia bacterium]|nr:carboxymuconolactone decarboxylase family protein [Dehalococcoidia bacterium]